MNFFKNKLKNSNPIFFSLFAIIAAFGTYSAMYAFRKPFAVATFGDLEFWGVSYKILLIGAQIIGYTLSKFIGIKVVSELKSNGRALGIIFLILMAEISLLLFAVTPAPYNIFFMFLNGLPLGMVWGFVFSFLEGRKLTELLAAGLCVSFIFSSGLVKSVGKFVMQTWGFSEFWMPFVTGALFLLPLVIFVYMLNQIPEPNKEDIALRTKRISMNRSQRKEFFNQFKVGLISLIIVYVLLTAFRDLRDNFAANIWIELGRGENAEIFTATEIPITFLVLSIMGLMFLIKDNFKALIISHYLILIGLVLAGLSGFLFDNNIINDKLWVILAGFGLYLGYVPYNSIFFERLIASFKNPANVGFLIYIADSFGYLGSLGVLFYKNFANPDMLWYKFFIYGSYVLSFVGIVLILFSLNYFKQKHKKLNGY